ncbi:MAG: FHA domain-containing protein, partial [Deltaproteobacteria bacterium]|nr:FHA domain-containing protein [Deltaproteobacteria bacterium]
MATLSFINDQGEEDIVHVGEDRPEVTVGRHKGCELRTKNNTASRRHARFVWKRDGVYVLEDLGSANGTYYKREKIDSVELEDGQTVYCGTFQIEFRLDERDRAAMEADGDPPPVPKDEFVETETGFEPETVRETGVPQTGPGQTMGY